MAKLFTEAEVERIVAGAVRDSLRTLAAEGGADRRVLDGFLRAQTDLALARSRADLAELKLDVVRAALEQANEELLIQRNQAEEHGRAKSRFFASLAHELRSPMGVVEGYAELLMQERVGPVNDRQRRFLGNIAASSRHLLALVNDLLDFSKIESGKLELNLEPADLRCALETVTNLLTLEAQEKGLELALELDPGLRPLVADEVRLRQIVFNLVGNAVKFTPEGGRVRVRAGPALRLHPAVRAAEALEIAVEDTGIGIASEETAHVFEEFHQSGDARAGKVKGTGLGLTISRRLARLHGGELWCESELGRGSRFTLQIPWLPPLARPEPREREAA